MHPMSSRRALSWLLALCLLVGQVAAFAHALGHLDPHGTAPDHACELCVAQAHFGGAVVPGKAFLPQAAGAPFVLPVARPLPCDRLLARHAAARAPPAAV